LPKAKGRSLFARSVNYALNSILTIFIVGFLLVAGVYFLLQGNTTKGSAVLARIEAALQDVVGDQFEVKLNNVNLSFSPDAKVVFKSNDIEIVSREDNRNLSTIGEIETKLNLYQVISGNSAIELIRLRNVELDADVIGSGRGVLLPTHLDKPFNIIGDTLSKFQNYLDEDQFKEFEIVDSRIKGAVLGRRQQEPIGLEYLSLVPDGKGQFILKSELKTDFSNIRINSSYSKSDNEGSNYRFEASGLHMREWFSNPDGEEGIIGSDAVIDLVGNIPFDQNQIAYNPTLNIKSRGSNLRMGKEDLTTVGSLDLNLRLLLDKNQIELDPSTLEMGRLTANWVGGIKPYNAQKGYGGSLRFDLIMQRGTFEPTLAGETVVPAGFQINGLYNVDDKDMLIDKILLTTKNGSVTGKGRMLFGGETPSLKASGTTEGISVTAIKQFWPFFMAEGAREWVHAHLIDGWVEKGTLKADIPPGVIFRIKEGAKVKPEEFNLELKMKNVEFRPFGEMPPIRKGNGSLEISGMKISTNLNSGTASAAGKKPVTIRSGSFVMKDYAAENRSGEAKLSLEGPADSIAIIADQKPLRVMERMKVSAEQFSGDGFADIVARFPINKGTTYSQIDWNVLLDLQNAASSKPLAGRKFSNANIVIDATPISAKVVGKARIDGVDAKINLVEPIGKSGKAKRKREVTATVSQKSREALGIDLKPVVEGPVDFTIVQGSGSDKYSVNFRNAKIAMPWVGWSKGKGIDANAEFSLQENKGVYNLKDFVLKGAGFYSAGDLVLTKRGLVSANIKQLKLNDGDSISVRLNRDKETYNISASGNSYDARGVINTLLYQGSFKQVQGGRSVNLTANFKNILGFEGRRIYNVKLDYQSRNGALTKLDLAGVGSKGGSYSAKAQRNGNETLFTLSSDLAGNALAFTNVYTKMQGGRISASLVRRDNGPFIGPIKLTDFTVVNEPRLAKMVGNVKRQIPDDRGQRNKVIPVEQDKKISFDLAQATIEKGEGYLNLKDAIIRNNIIGLSMDGLLYDKNDRMRINGTFMPANSVNLAVSAIPILGRFFANGKDRALIGITYQLKGARSNPELLVNPLSIVTPGFFNKVFEFR
jgi:hypothetical protein